MTVHRPSVRTTGKPMFTHILASLGAQEKTICTSMLWSFDSYQNRASADQYHLTVPRAQVSTHRGRVLFWSYPLTNYQFWMIAGSSSFFPRIHIKYVVLCHYGPALLGFWIQTDLGSENSASLFKKYRREDLFLPWSLVSHALRPIFILRLVKIWRVSSCGKIMRHLESCLLWQLKLTEFCVKLWCF